MSIFDPADKEYYKDYHNKYVRLYKKAKEEGNERAMIWYKRRIKNFRKLMGVDKK